MNRIDRLFAILLTLQHKRRVRAQDLARQFEISKRTIYRDMSTLNQMGIPIASLPGEGFEPVEGFYVPPLMFEAAAVALTLGLRLLTQQAAGSLTRVADCAACPLRSRCLSKAHTSRRYLSIQVESQPPSLIDQTKARIGGEEGKRIYARRLWDRGTGLCQHLCAQAHVPLHAALQIERGCTVF